MSISRSFYLSNSELLANIPVISGPRGVRAPSLCRGRRGALMRSAACPRSPSKRAAEAAQALDRAGRRQPPEAAAGGEGPSLAAGAECPGSNRAQAGALSRAQYSQAGRVEKGWPASLPCITPPRLVRLGGPWGWSWPPALLASVSASVRWVDRPDFSLPGWL